MFTTPHPERFNEARGEGIANLSDGSALTKALTRGAMVLKQGEFTIEFHPAGTENIVQFSQVILDESEGIKVQIAPDTLKYPFRNPSFIRLTRHDTARIWDRDDLLGMPLGRGKWFLLPFLGEPRIIDEDKDLPVAELPAPITREPSLPTVEQRLAALERIVENLLHGRA